MNKVSILLAIFTIFSAQAADISLDDQLFNAVDANNVRLMRQLLRQGADPNSNNGAPLKLAILHGNKLMIQYLMVNGAKLTYKKEGSPFSSPLEFAQNPKFNVPQEVIDILVRINAVYP